MANDVNVKIGVQGEADFKKQISECNTTLKTMGTEMAKVTSAFIGNEDSTKALKAANKQLTAQFDELNKKAEIQKTRLAELDAQGVDPTSASYQKLVQDLNRTETEMNKTAAQIDQNNEKLQHHGKTAEEAHARHAEAAKKAAEAVALVTAAVAAAAAALAKMTLDAAKAADELGAMSVKTGISTDELQKMQYAAESIDVSVETITGSMTKLTKNMASAASGSKSAQEAFKKLGVEVTNQDGTLRDRNEVFQEAIAALGEIDNAAERDATAMSIFGKSAQELNPLILGGAEALQQLGQHAEEAGLILSGEDIAALSDLNNQFDILKQTASMAGSQILAQFAGPMTEVMTTLTGYVERLVQAFKSGGISNVLQEVGTIAGEISAKIREVLPQAVKIGTEMLLMVVHGLISELPSVAESAISIITTLAESLSSAIPELVPVAVNAVLALVDTLTNPDSISNLVDAAIAITIGLANGLIQALPQLLAKAPEIISNLVTSLIENAPKLLAAGYEVIVTLISGLIDNLDSLGAACGQIIGTIVSGIAELATELWNTGKSIVEGIWAGIEGAWQWFKEKVGGFFKGIVDNVKSSLGIASPSKVFAGIGENMALGLGVGFDRAMAGVEQDIMSSIPMPGVTVAGANVSDSGTYADGSGAGVLEIVVPVMLDGEECGRGLYRYIVGEGGRVGPAMVTGGA